jgi:hypothetical protein
MYPSLSTKLTFMMIASTGLPVLCGNVGENTTAMLIIMFTKANNFTEYGVRFTNWWSLENPEIVTVDEIDGLVVGKEYELSHSYVYNETGIYHTNFTIEVTGTLEASSFGPLQYISDLLVEEDYCFYPYSNLSSAPTVEPSGSPSFAPPTSTAVSTSVVATNILVITMVAMIMQELL